MFILLTNCPFTIIDVRTPQEYARGHVPGALNIPFEEMPVRIKEVSDMPRPIITYCRSGNQSSAAISYLKEQGLDHVYNGGGIQDMLRSAQ
jgi:phage shock protein E